METSGFGRVVAGESALLRPVAILTVLLGLTAAAQPPSAARERQERRVALSGAPSDSVPELRVAAGVLTALVFDAPLDRSSVELEGRERFRIVDVGERIVALEPAVDLGPGERLGLRVRFAGDSTREPGVLALVSHASEVDTRVEVFRQNDSVELLRAELTNMRVQLKAQTEELETLRALRDSSGPVGLIVSGLLDNRVQISRIKIEVEGGAGKSLIAESATIFLAPAWAAISVKVRNPNKTPWAPASARIVSTKRGTKLGVLNVRLAVSQVAPGEAGLVVVETEIPPLLLGEEWLMELLDGNGVTQLAVPHVKF